MCVDLLDLEEKTGSVKRLNRTHTHTHIATNFTTRKKKFNTGALRYSIILWPRDDNKRIITSRKKKNSFVCAAVYVPSTCVYEEIRFLSKKNRKKEKRASALFFVCLILEMYVLLCMPCFFPVAGDRHSLIRALWVTLMWLKTRSLSQCFIF